MKEVFTIVAPQVRLAEQHGNSLWEIFFIGTGETLVKRLAVPVKPDPIQFIPVDAQYLQGTPLVDLPAELHWKIFDHIDTIEDVLCLAMAHPLFVCFAKRLLQQHFYLMFGRWANQKIVCVGDRVQPGDYPRALFSAEELEAISQEECQVYIEEADKFITMTPSTLHDFTKSGVSKIEAEPCMSDEIFRLRQYLLSKECKGADLTSLDLSPRSGYEYFPANEPWILRNLTTKQFVRAEAIALKPEYIHGPNIKILGFSEVVLSRICWSSPLPHGVVDVTNMCRGKWAGHRFDITTLARHARETGDGNGWVDVSSEVAEEIASIFRRTLGANWRELLCRSRWRRDRYQ